MDRLSLAIVDAPIASNGSSPGELLRLEWLPRSLKPLQLELLHEDHAGNDSRVFQGQLRLGNWKQPVAIKVQREEVFGRSAQEVITKFDRERQAHLQLQTVPGTDFSFARLLDIGSNPSTEADTLPPAILCRHAASALAPHCPICARNGVASPLSYSEGNAADGGDRKLRCEVCTHSFSFPGSVDSIHRATVKHDRICENCPHRPEDLTFCLNASQFLTFFPAKFLLQELLDLNLADYLLWSKVSEGSARRAIAWSRFSEHRKAYLQALQNDPYFPFRRALNLFDDLFRGLKRLREQKISHWDLKPSNIGLKFAGPEVSARLIDLGLAQTTHETSRTRRGHLPRELDHEYAAPEIQLLTSSSEPAIVQYEREWAFFTLESRTLNTVSSEEIVDPWICPGDEVEIEDPELGADQIITGHVTELQVTSSGMKVSLSYQLSPSPFAVLESRFEQPRKVTIRVCKQRGPAADLFSLGMVMVAVLGEDPNQTRFRGGLPSLLNTIWGVPSEKQTGSGSELVAGLRDSQNRGYIAPFSKLEARLAKWNLPRYLTEELLGILLRLILRDRRSHSYLSSRGDDVEQAHRRLEQDLQSLRTDFLSFVALQEAKKTLARQESLTRQLGEHLQSLNTQISSGASSSVDATILEESLLRLSHTGQLEREANRLLQHTGGDPRPILLALGVTAQTAEPKPVPELKPAPTPEPKPAPELKPAPIPKLKFAPELTPELKPVPELKPELEATPRIESVPLPPDDVRLLKKVELIPPESAETQHLLANILLYSQHLKGGLKEEQHFLQTWHRLQEPRYEGSKRWTQWRKGVSHLFELHEGFIQSRKICFEWQNRLQNALFFSLEQGVQAHPEQEEIEVTLKRSDLELLSQFAVSESLTFFRNSLSYLETLFQTRKEHFRQCITQWGNWCRESPSSVVALRAHADEEWQRILLEFQQWQQMFLDPIETLERFLKQIEESLYIPWREALIPPRGMVSKVAMSMGLARSDRLPEAHLAFHRGWLDQWQAITHPERGPLSILREIRLGPVFLVEVIFAMNWFEDLKLRKNPEG